MLAAFASCNFRMNEFTGAVLKGQLQKLETICGGLRKNAKEGPRGHRRPARSETAEDAGPGGRLGRDGLPGPWHAGAARSGSCGRCGPRESRPGDRAARSSSRPTSGSRTRSPSSPDWPSFNSPEGKAIQYGAESCPRTIDILGRHGGVIMDPSFTDDDTKDIVAAIRKVYMAMRTA